MFTGIIEQTAELVELSEEATNLRLTIKTNMLNELKVDQSIAHNGVCLTVEKINSDSYEVVAVNETLEKTNLANLSQGDILNLERCLRLSDRIDGHVVQGHVDEVAEIVEFEELEGSWLFGFKLKSNTDLIVEKGSICINGVSLTAFDVGVDFFRVTIIPYTFDHTAFKNSKIGDLVNIEFDILGKYVAKIAYSSVKK